MAKAKFGKFMNGLRGQIGDLIYRLMPDGSTVVNRAPQKKKIKFSKKQKSHQNRFSEAACYARQAAHDQPIYAELAAAATMKTAYNFALSDWFNPPEIHLIEQGEDYIFVRASDDVLVTHVRITIADQDGKVMEEGEATQTAGDWWQFASQAAGKTILAEAWDLPGNLTRFVMQ